MTKLLLFLTAVLSASSFVAAGEKPQTGTIISETSVECGSKTDKHKKSTELLCQEYVVRTATTDYHVRQPKPSNKALIPVNTSVEFTLSKDKMKFKANGKSYEYLVVSESAAGTTKPGGHK
jgi:hypothetical protein